MEALQLLVATRLSPVLRRLLSALLKVVLLVLPALPEGLAVLLPPGPVTPSVLEAMVVGRTEMRGAAVVAAQLAQQLAATTGRQTQGRLVVPAEPRSQAEEPAEPAATSVRPGQTDQRPVEVAVVAHRAEAQTAAQAATARSHSPTQRRRRSRRRAIRLVERCTVQT